MHNLLPEKNRRILIIDDNRAIHDDFRKILSPANVTGAALDAAETALFGEPTALIRQISFDVDSAYQGQEGVLLVQKALEAGHPYAMAFVDVRMPPGWDGVETTAKIWELDPEIQIVICTAYADYSWSEMFEKLGYRDGLLILKKPFDIVEALQLAQALTEKWWLHRQSRQKMQDLEGLIAERTGALASSLSLLNATFESMVDGIIAVDLSGKVASYNTKFSDTWQFPSEMLARRDAGELRDYVAGQVKDPAIFLQRIKEQQANPEVEVFDVFELKDGRTFERYIFPQWIDKKCAGTVISWRDITVRKRTEVSLRLLESAVEQTKESVVITDAELDLPGPRILFINPAFTKMTGYNEEEVLGKTPRILQGPLTDKSVLNRLRTNLERGKVFEGETINYRKDGKAFNMEWQIAPLRNTTGKITHFVAIQHDITERKRLEGQLFQSQKLETVGKLAGGFAHEFNSILTAIIGQGELLFGDLPVGSPLAKNATEIINAASRAATLTRQLLAYGRKQILQPETLDLNRVIVDMESMVRLLMGGITDTQVVPAARLHAVRADSGQIEQVIMNMVINARDAMPNGGKLILETANVSFDAETVGRYTELKPGDYVMLAITDTGTGMSEEVKARIFEPFFSTKGVGQGTGLGLATCYGIIKQSGGHISVYSELARGATFKIYLPRVEQSVNHPVERPSTPDLPLGTETILLAEDDPALREMAATLLRRLGYTVFTAANGIEALNLKQQRDIGHIDLVFTDVVMPHMSGKELADRMQALFPHTKILFTSAYTENAIVHQGVLDKNMALLQKPFTPSALAHKLREVLDQSNAPKSFINQNT
jgi:two-component system cell cycle sensor histidine kinase/response regulator CckA